MRGHVRKRGESNYSIVVDLDPGPDGKRKQKWISAAKYLNQPKATKKQAEAVLAEVLQKINTQSFVEVKEITVGKYLDYWLDTYVKETLRPTTYDNYHAMIRLHIIPELGHIQLSKLSALHLNEFYSEKKREGRADGREGGLSSRTVSLFHTILYTALKQAVAWEFLNKNIAEKANKPQKKASRKIDYWTPAEAKQFLVFVAEDWLYPLYYLALKSGMRRGEIIGLRWRDTYLDEGYVSIRQQRVKVNTGAIYQDTKTGKSTRNISISPKTVKVLTQHKEVQEENKKTHGEDYRNNGLVFCHPNGEPFYPDGITQRFETLVKRTELKRITFHGLRHTHATMLLLKNINPKVVSERLGHHSISITYDLYAHVMPSMDKEAALKLDDDF